MIFRQITPTRRNIQRNVSNYQAHRNDLSIDFLKRCGYCNGVDLYRTSPFEIDHFIPRKRDKKPFLTIKTETDYSNLIYACKSCNNAKSNKWPTNNESVSHENDEGFIDPCDVLYEQQFHRLQNGQIRATTKLGLWMLKELKLDKPQHEIIYNLEQLDSIIDQIVPNLEKLEDIDISKRINCLLLKYRAYIRQLGRTS
jgi:hypothetical protein